jgi:gamma-polyglutamate biosynthesis protein CapA
MGDHPKAVGFGFYSTYRSGIPQARSANLVPTDHTPDILCGNLEFGLASAELDTTNYEDMHCRGIAAYADFLRDAGFNVLNLANNHIFQHGEEDFRRTVDLLTDRGIRVAGLTIQNRAPAVFEIGGESISFLGWSDRPRQGFHDDPPYAEYDEDASCSLIERARRQHSVVIVSMHWGDEFVAIPSPEERRRARKMIDAGAHVVVGHHPHVVREVEEYSHGLIAYSLGNFAGDMIWNPATAKTCYLRVDFSEGSIADWQLIHGRIGTDYLPVFPAGEVDHVARPDVADERAYQRLAMRAHRRHRTLTLLHMLRNGARFAPQVWLSMLSTATFGDRRSVDPPGSGPEIDPRSPGERP